MRRQDQDKDPGCFLEAEPGELGGDRAAQGSADPGRLGLR